MTADVALPQKWFDFQIYFLVTVFDNQNNLPKGSPNWEPHPFVSTCANSEVRLAIIGVSVRTCAVPALLSVSVFVGTFILGFHDFSNSFCFPK